MIKQAVQVGDVVPWASAFIGGAGAAFLAHQLAPKRYKKLFGALGLLGGAAGAYYLAGKTVPWFNSKFEIRPEVDPAPLGVTSDNNRDVKAKYDGGMTPKSSSERVKWEHEVASRNNLTNETAAETSAAYQNPKTGYLPSTDLGIPKDKAPGVLNIMHAGLSGVVSSMEQGPAYGAEKLSPYAWYYNTLNKITSPVSRAVREKLLDVTGAHPGSPVGIASTATPAVVGFSVAHKLRPLIGRTIMTAAAGTRAAETVGGFVNAVKPVAVGADVVTMLANTARGFDDASESSGKFSQGVTDAVNSAVGNNATPAQAFAAALLNRTSEVGLDTYKNYLTLTGKGNGMVTPFWGGGNLHLGEIYHTGKELGRIGWHTFAGGGTARDRRQTADTLELLLRPTDNMSTGGKPLALFSGGYFHQGDKEYNKMLEGLGYDKPANMSTVKRDVDRANSIVGASAEDIAREPELRRFRNMILQDQGRL